MAELVDALGSGPSGGNTVQVRVLFWATIQYPIRKNEEPVFLKRGTGFLKFPLYFHLSNGKTLCIFYRT